MTPFLIVLGIVAGSVGIGIWRAVRAEDPLSYFEWENGWGWQIFDYQGVTTPPPFYVPRKDEGSAERPRPPSNASHGIVWK